MLGLIGGIALIIVAIIALGGIHKDPDALLVAILYVLSGIPMLVIFLLLGLWGQKSIFVSFVLLVGKER